jgi:hypothetical protein
MNLPPRPRRSTPADITMASKASASLATLGSITLAHFHRGLAS